MLAKVVQINRVEDRRDSILTKDCSIILETHCVWNPKIIQNYIIFALINQS